MAPGVPGSRPGAEGEAAEGNDGERGWSWRPPEVGGPPGLPVGVGVAYPPPPELFCPSGLLGGFTLEVLGPVTVAGRDAVAAAPRRDVLGSGSAERPYDRVEVAVDAELGILLRRIETSGGELVTLTELTDVTMNPPQAADPARFAPPPGSHRGETEGENPGAAFSGPGWAAADLAAGGLGALLRYAPHLLGHGAAGEQAEAMPSPDPAPLEPADGSPPPDEVLELLYRSGEPRDLGATARQWLDLFAMAAPLPEGFRAAGRGGLGDLFDAMTRGTAVARTEARLRVSGPDRYRLDFSSRRRRIDSTTIACDGERRWQVFQDRILVGPAAPLRDNIAFLADSCWLRGPRARWNGGRNWRPTLRPSTGSSRARSRPPSTPASRGRQSATRRRNRKLSAHRNPGIPCPNGRRLLSLRLITTASTRHDWMSFMYGRTRRPLGPFPAPPWPTVRTSSTSRRNQPRPMASPSVVPRSLTVGSVIRCSTSAGRTRAPLFRAAVAEVEPGPAKLVRD